MSFRLYSRTPRRYQGRKQGKAPLPPLPDAGVARRAKSALSGFQELNVTRDFEVPVTGKVTLPVAQLGDSD